MCSIISVEAKAYKVVTRQIMIKPDNVQILEREDELNAVCVYNTVTNKNKPAW
jgi:hypothetical protein